jgi:NAD(P)-dependent dehydrogenase (short-subunit alcohol dehydrogenase family)
LSVLINNAAIQILASTDTLSRADWRKTLDVNLLAPFFWTQVFLPELEEASGSVINISSIHAHLTKPSFVAYATSKSALSSLTRSLAVDLGGRVRVNAIEPAAIETEMLRHGFMGDTDLYARLAACHPSGTVGKPEDVANLALVLAGAGQFLSGAIVSLSGGIDSRLHDPEHCIDAGWRYGNASVTPVVRSIEP